MRAKSKNAVGDGPKFSVQRVYRALDGMPEPEDEAEVDPMS